MISAALQFDRHSSVVDDVAFETYQKNGFVLLLNALTKAELERVKHDVDELAAFERENEVAHIYGQNLQRIWNLVGKNNLFQELITAPQLLAWAERIFDRNTTHQKYYLSSFQANMLHPGAKAQPLHIDTPVPDPLPLWEMKINTIWLLDDFTDSNGATEIIPGSHKFGRRPQNLMQNDFNGLQKVIAPAGSLLLTSGALWHRSGENRSSAVRRVLLGSFAASYFREIASEEDAVRYQLTRSNIKMNEACWKLIGGKHGLKPGI